MDYRYIVVEGPIGVGKTTLARRLARSLGGEPLLEAPEENPFLERFYENPRRFALSTQLSFLLQRARQIEELRQADLFSRLRVGDFLLEKDRLFAGLTLDVDELRLYDQVHVQLVDCAPPPDLVIYLQAPVSVLSERISRRGVAYERHIDTAYLQRLVEAYTALFYNYETAPLLIVNSAGIDLAHGDEDYELLLQQVRATGPGRHYFNPQLF